MVSVMLAVLASCMVREAEPALAHALDKKSARTIQPFLTGRERIRTLLRGSERLFFFFITLRVHERGARVVCLPQISTSEDSFR